MKKHVCASLYLFILFFSMTGFSQLSPPGLGPATTAGWFAVGVKQNLDVSKERQSVTYLGMGRKSDATHYNPYLKPAIFVVNQEFCFRVRKHWNYSLALSYRKQNNYKTDIDSPVEQTGSRQEFRLYGRFSRVLKTGRLKAVITARQELRKFYDPGFTISDERFQLRSRMRFQLTTSLNAIGTQKLVASYEALFSAAEKGTGWSSLQYSESRFCVYYSWSPANSPFIFNTGYMYDLVGKNQPLGVHYLAFDVIWENPFQRSAHK